VAGRPAATRTGSETLRTSVKPARHWHTPWFWNGREGG
jgi:hypothetical protein